MARMQTTMHKTLYRKATSPLGRLNRLLLVTTIGLIVFEVLMSNAQASNGSRMVELQQQYEQLQLEVTEMELEVSSYSSLNYIEHYATEKMGMEPVKENVLYMQPNEEK